jgi:hypothetical protein
MVGERDREQLDDAVRWEELDDAAISIPPPFNSTYNGAVQHNRLHHLHQQHHQQHIQSNQHQPHSYAAMLAASEDMQSHWDDEQMGLMGDSMVGCIGMPSIEKGVRFPTSPTHVGYNGQLSQAPLQRTHSRYSRIFFF